MYDAWEEYDLLCEMCEEIVKKGDISPSELDNLYKAAKTKYYIVATDAMMNAGDDDYGSSMDNMSMARGMSRAGYPYSNNSRRSSYANNGGNSGRRSSRANYSMRNYSGHDRKEMLMQRIAEMQDELDRMGE